MALGIKRALYIFYDEKSKNFNKLLNGGAWEGILRKEGREVG
jgi:hypothetical protein